MEARLAQIESDISGLKRDVRKTFVTALRLAEGRLRFEERESERREQRHARWFGLAQHIGDGVLGIARGWFSGVSGVVLALALLVAVASGAGYATWSLSREGITIGANAAAEEPAP